jgi:hypothetical protein
MARNFKGYELVVSGIPDENTIVVVFDDDEKQELFQVDSSLVNAEKSTCRQMHHSFPKSTGDSGSRDALQSCTFDTPIAANREPIFLPSYSDIEAQRIGTLKDLPLSNLNLAAPSSKLSTAEGDSPALGNNWSGEMADHPRLWVYITDLTFVTLLNVSIVFGFIFTITFPDKLQSRLGALKLWVDMMYPLAFGFGMGTLYEAIIPTSWLLEGAMRKIAPSSLRSTHGAIRSSSFRIVAPRVGMLTQIRNAREATDVAETRREELSRSTKAGQCISASEESNVPTEPACAFSGIDHTTLQLRPQILHKLDTLSLATESPILRGIICSDRQAVGTRLP